MATMILKIPRSIDGCVVECGCYRGGSTANLSLVCALTGRRLEVFDSFRGLPEPKDQDTNTLLGKRSTKFQRGQFQGDLDDVQANVSQWGDVSVCRFNAGYFDNVLPQVSKECVLVFLDVDLRSSLETCVRYLWPLLQDECYLFTHEAQDTEARQLRRDFGQPTARPHQHVVCELVE